VALQNQTGVTNQELFTVAILVLLLFHVIALFSAFAGATDAVN
jgi:hypothetical protein